MFEIIETITINNLRVYKIKSSYKTDWYIIRNGSILYFKDLKYERNTEYKSIFSIVGFNTEDWEDYYKIKDTL